MCLFFSVRSFGCWGFLGRVIGDGGLRIWGLEVLIFKEVGVGLSFWGMVRRMDGSGKFLIWGWGKLREWWSGCLGF